MGHCGGVDDDVRRYRCRVIADAPHVGAPGAFLFLLTAELAAVLAGVGGVSVYVIGTWTVIGALSDIAVSLSGWALSPHGPLRSALHAATAAVNGYLSDSTPRSLHHAVRALHDAWDCFDDAGISDHDIPITLALRHVHRRLVRAAPAVHECEASELDDVHVYRPLRRPGVLHRVCRAATPGSRTWTITIRVFVACTVAGLGSVALGLSRPDWAVISVAMILHQGPDRVLGSFRAVHRFAGTVVGLALLYGLQMGAPSAGAGPRRPGPRRRLARPAAAGSGAGLAGPRPRGRRGAGGRGLGGAVRAGTDRMGTARGRPTSSGCSAQPEQATAFLQNTRNQLTDTDRADHDRRADGHLRDERGQSAAGPADRRRGAGLPDGRRHGGRVGGQRGGAVRRADGPVRRRGADGARGLSTPNIQGCCGSPWAWRRRPRC